MTKQERSTKAQAILNRTATDAYIQHIQNALDNARRLTEYLEDHGGNDPDDINWTHVGDIAHVDSELQAIADFTFSEGEYA